MVRELLTSTAAPALSSCRPPPPKMIPAALLLVLLLVEQAGEGSELDSRVGVEAYGRVRQGPWGRGTAVGSWTQGPRLGLCGSIWAQKPVSSFLVPISGLTGPQAPAGGRAGGGE